MFDCCCLDSSPPSSGQVVVAPLGGKGLRNTESFGKSDPYVVVTIGAQSGQTEVAKNMGSDPSWNTKLTFTLDGTAKEINFVIYDKDTMSKDDVVGNASFKLATLKRDRHYHGEVPVLFEDQEAGTMSLDIEHIPA